MQGYFLLNSKMNKEQRRTEVFVRLILTGGLLACIVGILGMKLESGEVTQGTSDTFLGEFGCYPYNFLTISMF